MKSLKGSKTATNLMAAFAGESQARNRYSFFAEIARCDGYMQIANIFEETANQEKGHARRFYQIMSQYLNEEEIEICEKFPISLSNETIENLKAAYKGESFEAENMYPNFARIAEEEGFKEISKVFTEISEIEEYHAKRFKALANNIRMNNVFKKDTIELWQCLNCGYIHEGYEAPRKCPACAYPQEYFKILCEDY